MSLIRRTPDKKPHDHGLKALALLLRALVAQRVARKAYRGYKWSKRLPFIVGGTAIVAFLLGRLQKRRGGEDTSAPTTTASHPSTTTTAASSPPATTPSTPTPTGSPTAVTPAPTAAADGAPDPGSDDR